MEEMRALISTRVHEDVWIDYGYDEAGIRVDFGGTFFNDMTLDPDGQDPWEYRIPGLMPFVMDRDARIREVLE